MSGKPAARLSDTDACPLTGHGPNPIASGSPDVLINGLPAARVGDSTACGDVIVQGSATVFVNGQPLALLGSATAHGGVIISGSGDVLVGDQVSQAAFIPPSPMPGYYDEHFVLHDEVTGAPLADRAYRLRTAGGQVIEGRTDDQGRTRAHTAAQAESLSVDFEPQTAIVIG
ncbi:putative Zn-binding protein involved in type VI secretion [Pseudomonas psychrotolerans]|uniref:Zn-binding protein involved in type VI secretion n=1 Tax=Pseudomonas oryzihabitans TaxID=47885 RepID=A0AAJ2BPN8_9PSED|nr:PAAR domain-containing protein [Pseudomonas psychrotolerans]MDR6235191.1 putative Zn-binding protein involved in type VI secretion [Pseudomonas psychrotolerans]MDR6355587.1 putative Zn-binding protein involved in type VI secretion [Pseudomonas psychrotolerans]